MTAAFQPKKSKSEGEGASVSSLVERHGDKMIEVRLRFWTHELGAKPGETRSDGNVNVTGGAIKPKHAWTSGAVSLEPNRHHHLKESTPIPFESLESLPAAIEQLLEEHGVELHNGMPSGQAQRRRAGRVSGETYQTPLGKILDISSGGMRVVSSHVPRGPFEIAVTTTNETLRLRARVVWVKPAGLFRHELGIQFMQLTDELAKRLLGVPINSRIQRVI